MDVPKAIVVAAVVLGASFVLGNLYKIAPQGVAQGAVEGGIYRINTVTGDVVWCQEDVNGKDTGGQVVCERLIIR